MSRPTDHLKGLTVMATLCLLGSLWPNQGLRAQTDDHPEVGGSAPTTSADINLPKLTILGSRLEICTQYTALGGDDMERIYGGVPQIGVGLSVQTAYGMRTYVSLGYGRASGDPYEDRAGISAPGEARISVVPLQIGVRFDAAESERVHFNISLGLSLAWMRESLPPNVPGQSDRVSASGTNSGYRVSFGPEFLWGDGPSSIGLELGWGGGKGRVRDDDQRHDVDLTGLQARLYVGLAL